MIRLPAEWEPQAFVQFTFPYDQGDWADHYDEVVECFVKLISAVAQYEKTLVVCHDIANVKSHFNSTNNIHFAVAASNDAWARDHGAITVMENDHPCLLDFDFNGWGQKYPCELDNRITQHLYDRGTFGSIPISMPGLVLEGGAIESDGVDTLLTTSSCLLSENRNPSLTKQQIEKHLKHQFGLERILWLDHGHLTGDDTDGHIDTLARFCNKDAIAYVQCTDPNDEHYASLQQMEAQLKTFTKSDGQPYRLAPLPMVDPCYDEENNRLPATYANFLICNGAVIVPTYNAPQDEKALDILSSVFWDRDVIGINCLPLIRQYGSLHCVTMQYPEGVPLIT
ncbi:MAG: agmatine deiminase family protein [Bacteroidota bacterium]